MRILGRKRFIAAIAAAIFALILWAGVTPPVSANAETAAAENTDYHYSWSDSYTIDRYDVDMTVEKNRVVTVEERITVTLRNGYYGIIRDFPLGNEIRYRNFSAKCSGDNTSGFTTYVSWDSGSYLSWCLDTNSSSERQVVFTLDYEMILPVRSKTGLSLDVIGYGFDTAMNDVTVNVTFPDGLKNYKIYSGGYGTESDKYTDGGTVAGNTLTVKAEKLPVEPQVVNNDWISAAAGITVDFEFESGVLSASFDLSILWALLLGLLAVAVGILLKLFVCRSPQLVRTVNLEAPNRMDPLRMGKLIDNKVDGEDLGALVFWLASKDYLTIDLTQGEDDPVLIRTDKAYAEDMPRHCRIFCDGLFGKQRAVRVSSLQYVFYRTAEEVKANLPANNMFAKKSKICAVIYGVLSIAVLGLFALLYALGTLGINYFWIAPLLMSIPSFLIAYAGSRLAAQRYFKWKMPKKVALIAVCVIVGILISLISLIIPCAAFGVWTGVLLVSFAAGAGAVGGSFVCRTPEYNEELGHILGFKQFIEVTERDKIEFMLNEDPDLYYNILPYAQVLGITDQWTDKFKGLDLQPPKYARYGMGRRMFTCMVWHSMFHRMNRSFAHHMVSRPSNSSPTRTGGGSHGGFGGGRGGFGGGGFGGGGGRGLRH